MTVYVVTTTNWNDPAFWSSIDQVGAGHTLDFSGLTSAYSITWDPTTGQLFISDGTTSFKVEDSTNPSGPPPDATLGGTTKWSLFRNIVGTEADVIYGGVGDVIDGGESAFHSDTLIVTDVDRIEYDPANPENGTVFFSGGGSLAFTNIEGVTATERDGTVSGTAGDDHHRWDLSGFRW